MATRRSIRATFGARLPGRTGAGTPAAFRKSATIGARESMKNVIARYEKLIRSMKSATPDILYNAMIPVFEKSQEYVPKDTGALEASGVLEVSTGEFPAATITYGDKDTWYAALVHEFVWLNHEPPTRAKYLQNAMEEEIDSFLVSMAVDYATLLGGR